MSRFKYLARNAAAEKVCGFIEATSERDAMDQLSIRKLFVVAIEPTPNLLQWSGGLRRVSKRRLATLFSQLADLLKSGVSLQRSLEVIARQSSDAQLREIVMDMSRQLAEGASLSESMREHRGTFGELAISMVAAGEESGFLEQVLLRISDYMQRQQRLQSRILGALAYPAFLLCVSGLVLVVMMTVFVPNFAPIFERMREAGQLPPLTNGLLIASDLASSNWLWILVLVVLLVVVGITWARGEAGGLVIDRFKLKIPGMKRFWRGLAVARFSRILGTMLAGGVPILQALRISKDSTGNRVLAAAIDDAAGNLEHGEGLSEPLRRCGVFPEDVIEMIAVGEESNNLERVLIDVADTIETKLADETDVLLRLLEPVLLLVLAAITLLIVTALLLPVFSMGQLI